MIMACLQALPASLELQGGEESEGVDVCVWLSAGMCL